MNRELIKDLPAVFEEFNEQRKKSFVTAMEMQQKGVPFVGVFCTYLPQELPMAMGAAVVGLCSMSGETIPEEMCIRDSSTPWPLISAPCWPCCWWPSPLPAFPKRGSSAM